MRDTWYLTVNNHHCKDDQDHCGTAQIVKYAIHWHQYVTRGSILKYQSLQIAVRQITACDAMQLCREHLGRHPCDKRRCTSHYRQQFPAVDFSLVSA